MIWFRRGKEHYYRRISLLVCVIMMLGMFLSFSPLPAGAASSTPDEDLLASYLQTLYNNVRASGNATNLANLQQIYDNATALAVYDPNSPSVPWTMVFADNGLSITTLATTQYSGDVNAAATNVSYLLRDFAELIYYGSQGTYSDSVLDDFWNKAHSPDSTETNAETLGKIAGSAVTEEAFCGYMYSSLTYMPTEVTTLMASYPAQEEAQILANIVSGNLADPTTNLFVQDCLAGALNDVATTGGYGQFKANASGANWSFGDLVNLGYRPVDGSIGVINGVPSSGEVILTRYLPLPSKGGGGGGGGNTPTQPTYPAVPPPQPPVTGLSESVFIARWPSHVNLEDQAVWIAAPEDGSSPAVSFTVYAPAADALAAATAQGLEQRVYYFNENVQKWIALASYPQPDGSVKVINDGGYDNCWTAMFGVLEPHYTDIAGNWAEDVVNRMNGLALIEGYPISSDPNALDRTSGVDRNITRAEFATILARALGCLPTSEQKLYNLLTPEGESPDQILAGWQGVPDWSRDFVASMISSGLAKGEGSNDFAGNNTITRAEAATMIYNMLEKINPDLSQGSSQKTALQQFSDASDIPSWAQAGVAQVLTGYPNGTVQPNASITRAEALVTVLKLLRALGF